MATREDILGNNDMQPAKGTMAWAQGNNDATAPAPKGTPEWLQQNPENNTGGSTQPSVKGSQAWAEQNSGENAPVKDPTTAKPDRPAPVAEVRSFVPGRVETDQDLVDRLMPKPKSEEELEKERKRYRRNQIINAVGEGLSALSNLFFTTKGAPSMYNSKNNSVTRAKASYEKMLADNRKNSMAYLIAKMQAKQADEARFNAEREWQRKLQIDAYNRALSDAKEKRDQELFKLNLQLQQQKITAAEAEALTKQIEAEYADAKQQAELNSEIAKGNSYKAAAGASQARANYYNKGGSEGFKPAEFIWYDADGNEHYAHSAEAAEQNARRSGTWNDETQTSTTTKTIQKGRKPVTETTTTTKPGKGYSKPRNGEDDTPPSMRNKDNTPPSMR